MRLTTYFRSNETIIMQIGVMNHPARDPIGEIEWIGNNGFDFVDFTLEPPAADPDQIDPEAIRAVLDLHGLGVVAHTAYYLPLASPFARVRRACLDEFRLALKAAYGIGATVMNTHFNKPPKFFSEKQIVDWHAEVLGPLCDDAKQLGMTVVLEHIPFGGKNQLEIISDLLNEVPLLRFHLDSGHAKLEREYDRWEEYLDRLGEKLLHVHLSENDGTADQHLPLGSVPRSKTNWPKHIQKLKATGYDRTITLEVFAPEKENLLLSRDLLKKWWDEA
jgi:sugar phosphate isomerase/epimerase